MLAGTQDVKPERGKRLKTLPDVQNPLHDESEDSEKSFGLFMQDERSIHNESEDSENSFGLFTRNEFKRKTG